MGSNAGQNPNHLDWFGDVINRAQFKAFHFIGGAVKGGHKNNGDVLGERVGFKLAAGFKPVNARHHYIQQNNIGQAIFDAGDSRFAAGSHQNLVPGLLQIFKKHTQISRNIIYQQNGFL